MEIILKYEDLVGKTIKKVTSILDDKFIAIHLSDDYLIIMKAEPGWGSGDEEIELVMPGELDLCDQRDLGVITHQEYKAITEAQEKQRTERIRKRELEQLKRLQAKYQGDCDG